ncbi:MAG TPA: diguanylate phosphodiesterase [Hyphomonadaceae bacterium]|nr:diguanylate phosphodiesterase [Hyphomonadaceae bacterium]
MPWLSHVLVGASYAMAAALLGAASYRFGGASAELAIVLALCLGFGAAQAHFAVLRNASTQKARAEITALRASQMEIAKEFVALENKLEEMRASFDRETIKRNDAVVAEMRVLENLVTRLGEKFSARLAEARQSGPASGEAAVAPALASLGGGQRGIERLRETLLDNRVELHVQPIMALPQRRAAFYEGFTRLKDRENRLIMPAEFLRVAQEGGLTSAIDNLLLFRCVQIVRGLTQKDRRIGVFCNIARATLGDESFFPTFLEFMTDHADLAGSVFFELGQDAFDRRNGIDARHMQRLVDLGFRFSIDKVDRLDVELAELEDCGVRFFKVEGAKMVQFRDGKSAVPRGNLMRNLDPGDLSALFERYNIHMIAEKLEDERAVIEALDLDIRYGQGHVFGAPRPVRDDFFGDFTPPPAFRTHLSGGN